MSGFALAAASAACLWAGPVSADGFFEFDSLTEPQLFELHMAVGDELVARGVLGDMAAAIDGYAAFLVVDALGLEPEPSAPGADRRASGPGGGRYVIKGLRPAAGAPASIHGLGGGAPGFDVLAVVVFTPNAQISRAVLAPADVVAPMLDAEGVVAVGPALLSAPGVTDITPQVFRAGAGQ